MGKRENLYSANVASTACWMGALISGFGLGAAVMYLFDPDRGRGRRARLSDQMASKANRFSDAVESRTRDLRNRAQGLLHEASSILPGTGRTTKSENPQMGDAANRSQVIKERASQRFSNELV